MNSNEPDFQRVFHPLKIAVLCGNRQSVRFRNRELVGVVKIQIEDLCCASHGWITDAIQMQQFQIRQRIVQEIGAQFRLLTAQGDDAYGVE